MNTRTIGIFVLLVIIFTAVGILTRKSAEPPAPAVPIGERVSIPAPLGLPPVPMPDDNPPTAETIALGRRLYYDPALSVDDTVSCATCHSPEFGFSDGQAVSTGVGGQKGGRNAPTVFNAAYFTTQFWDGRSPSLEDQAEGPVQNTVEMGHTLEGVEKKLSEEAGYVEMFERAYGPGPITFEKVEKAIAAFERTIISGNSSFDRWDYGKEEDAVDDSVKRGFEVFRDPEKGNCAICHEVGEEYALFTDNTFHNLGVGVKGGELTDMGRFDVTQAEEDRGAFKTPSLRNVALTAPYMHDGSLRTLKEVIDFYLGGGNSNLHLDKEIHALGDRLTGQDREDLLAFLESLTGEVPPNVGPPGEGAAK